MHGLHATIATEISYIFKGELVTDTVYFRSLHLKEVLVKSGDTVPWDKVIGITGDTGKLKTPADKEPAKYGFHAHEETYTEGGRSPYLDFMTKTRNATPVISYNNKYYYDKFIFADRDKYKKIGKTAYDYSTD
jgi:hypothetical protein